MNIIYKIYLYPFPYSLIKSELALFIGLCCGSVCFVSTVCFLHLLLTHLCTYLAYIYQICVLILPIFIKTLYLFFLHLLYLCIYLAYIYHTFVHILPTFIIPFYLSCNYSVVFVFFWHTRLKSYKMKFWHRCQEKAQFCMLHQRWPVGLRRRRILCTRQEKPGQNNQQQNSLYKREWSGVSALAGRWTFRISRCLLNRI